MRVNLLIDFGYNLAVAKTNKITKIVAYLGCSAGCMHFALTNCLKW